MSLAGLAHDCGCFYYDATKRAICPTCANPPARQYWYIVLERGMFLAAFPDHNAARGIIQTRAKRGPHTLLTCAVENTSQAPQ